MRSAWDSGWHVVRPGDTMEGLAERFLGSSQLWRELHRLNPDVQDPDLLHPGQRLRIFLERPTPEPSAQIVSTARRVNQLPRPAPWRPAAEGDVLLEKDGVRTEKSASARLLFDDGVALTMSEDSLVFIRRQTRASAPSPRKEIEVELGQADVESSPTANRASSIEVVVGGARAASTVEAGKPLKARSRKSESNTAQFMVFDGQSTVAAAGKKVEVPAGSGTTVAPKSPPAPPEPLLPAPGGLEPGADGEFDRSAPRLAWQAVPGAASYTVEVCRDPACGSLAEIQRGVAGASAAPRESLEGELFWRVTAVAASGLDGFPSRTQRMVAVESVRPPAPSLALATPAGTRIASGGCTNELPELDVRAADRNGKSIPWTPVLDGRAISLDELKRTPLAGRHELVARATDERGRSSDSVAVPVTIDGAGPWLELTASGAAPAGTAGEERKEKEGEAPPLTCDSALELRGPAGNWGPVPCSTSAAGEPLAVTLSGTGAAFELRTAADGLAIGGMPIVPGEGLRLTAWEIGCGLTGATFRIAPSSAAAGTMELVGEVADAAGNRRTLAWSLGR